MKKLFLIDGSAFAYRAFYAIGELRNSKGQSTNAVYGFIKMLQKIIDVYKPTHLAIAFDRPKPTFRHEQYKEYKAHRKPTPDDLISQFPLIKKVINAFNIPLVEVDRYEADDVLATLARRAEEGKYEIKVVSNDKDLFQLVNENVKIIRTTKEDVVYDSAKVKERYGVIPEQIPDLLAVMGDASDNIPGVPGVGEKTGAKLLQQYGTVGKMIAEVDSIKSDRIKKSILEHQDQLRMNLELVTVRNDVPLDIDIESCKVAAPNTSLLKDLYRELEFKGLLKKMLNADGDKKVKSEAAANSDVAWQDLFPLLQKKDRLSVVSVNDQVVIAYEDKDDIKYFVCTNEQQEKNNFWGLVGELLSDANKTVYTYGFKSIIKKVPVNASYFDVAVAAYLLNPSKNDYSLESILFEYLKEEREGEELAVGLYRLVPVLEKKLLGKRLFDLYKRIELPLIEVLAGMEAKGIKIDIKGLASLSTEVEGEIEFLTEKIYKLAEEEFNINSHKSLEKILFTKLNLPKRKKTKTGYSTDVDVLTELAGYHELPKLVLEYRQLAKLKGTYIDPLPKQVDPETSRLHTTFNQLVTATGRLSSTNPNLQNIPVKNELGRKIRGAFIPGTPDWCLLGADYSQIELRLLAHLSGDKGLIKAFQQNEDIHDNTALQLFSEVTPETRRKAKAVNFGIIYGMGARGLAKALRIGVKESQNFIDTYFKKYPGVASFIEDTLAEAKIYGYVSTMFGRKRWIPELLSMKPHEQAFGERVAVNTPLQGSAADIIKIAMISIHRKIKEEKLPINLLLQIHDELIFELPPEAEEQAKAIVRKEMEGAVELKIPLKVDVKVGKSWAEI